MKIFSVNLKQAKQFMNDGYVWMVALDLSNYFNTIHHDRLMSVLYQDIKDEKVLKLIRKFLQSEVVRNDGRVIISKSNQGAIQGGNLSPLLANIYLNELDWELSGRGIRFIRYADDITLFLRDRISAEKIYQNIRTIIECKLLLKVNQIKTMITTPSEIKMLGFEFYIENNEYKSYIPKTSIQRLKDKCSDNIYKADMLGNAVKQINEELIGWTSHYSQADKPISQRKAKEIDRIILDLLYKRFKPGMNIVQFKEQLRKGKGQVGLVSIQELWKKRMIKSTKANAKIS
jgi:RNA-directed DNA polymerase